MSPHEVISGSGAPTLLPQILESNDDAQLVSMWPSLADTYHTWPTDAMAFDAAFRMAEALRLAGHRKDARALASFALETAHFLKDESRISRIQVLAGALALGNGEVAEARKAFQEALVAARRTENPGAVCRALLWNAYLEQLSGYLPVALTHAQECLAVAGKFGLEVWRASAVRSYAQACYLAGRLVEARTQLLDALNTNESELAKLEGPRLQLELALVNALLGGVRDLDQQFEAARAQFVSAGSIRDVAVSYEYEAVHLMTRGDLSAAVAAIREAVRISLAEFPDGDMTSQSYRIWAEIDLKRGDVAGARGHAEDALGVARRVGERIELGALERIFGQCDDVEGDVEISRNHFAESIRILSDCGARHELAHTHLAAGRAETFDRASRLLHLNSALALFREMQVDSLAHEAEECIRHLTSPPRPRAEVRDVNTTVITRNPAMKQVLAELDRFKDTPHVVLLEGETGAGKDLLAAYLHFTSHRADRPFVEFNAAAVPEALVESELFGHVRGSFTGAMRDREGLLFAAKNGTFFFNEIGEAPLAFQAKLLTMIESRRARPVGANAERPIEARLIFATNRNLQTEVSKGRFRKDLYFRMSTAHLKVPPLRDRIEDIALLLAAFLRREGLSQDQVATLEATAEWSTLGSWPWEGNVRELSSFAQRLAVEVLCDARSRPELVLQRLMKRAAQATAESREVFDRCRIESALKKHSGNKRRAAGDLGIPESTLRWKINHLGIQLP